MLRLTSRTGVCVVLDRHVPWNDAAVVRILADQQDRTFENVLAPSNAVLHSHSIRDLARARMDPQASENESKEYAIVQLETCVQAEEEATQSCLDGSVKLRPCRGAQYCGCCFQPKKSDSATSMSDKSYMKGREVSSTKNGGGFYDKYSSRCFMAAWTCLCSRLVMSCDNRVLSEFERG